MMQKKRGNDNQTTRDISQFLLLGLRVFMFCSDVLNLFLTSPHLPNQAKHHQQQPPLQLPSRSLSRFNRYKIPQICVPNLLLNHRIPLFLQRLLLLNRDVTRRGDSASSLLKGCEVVEEEDEEYLVALARQLFVDQEHRGAAEAITPTDEPMTPQNLQNIHVKLLAFDLLSLTQIPTSSDAAAAASFARRGVPLSRAEILGTVTSRDSKPGNFLRFSIDDGTGCVPCILWLNQLTSPYFSRRRPPDVRLIADLANGFASLVKIGAVARVRGRITGYRGAVQITVSDVVIERDPNMETLHWLDCVRLARKCYDPLALSRK
ncbi:CST complex subunit STN1 [Linum perenne]